MALLLAIFVPLVVLLFILAILSRVGDPETKKRNAEAFDIAAAGETSGLSKLALKGAKAVSGLDIVNPPEESPTYNMLRNKLAASGGLYVGSPTVFLSVQAACLITAGVLFAGVMLSGIRGWLLVIICILAAIIAYHPWQRVSEAVKTRAYVIDYALPEFAELLLMPISSGYGILPALDFTAARLSGPVSDEVKYLLSVLGSRSMDEKEAFEQAGLRLGTPAAQAFFVVLGQAYLEGTAASEVIRGQAEQLRKLAYERTREKIKVLPNKLVIIMGLHLMPTLFAVVLLPLMLSWSM